MELVSIKGFRMRWASFQAVFGRGNQQVNNKNATFLGYKWMPLYSLQREMWRCFKNLILFISVLCSSVWLQLIKICEMSYHKEASEFSFLQIYFFVNCREWNKGELGYNEEQKRKCTWKHQKDSSIKCMEHKNMGKLKRNARSPSNNHDKWWLLDGKNNGILFLQKKAADERELFSEINLDGNVWDLKSLTANQKMWKSNRT